ncbi:MAG: N-6 DNA methylase [Planctomycetaceae bacterium]|nr:N-6 DNA methylase [Planctomycetaceae bacterium]
MKLYAYILPTVPEKSGWLKIGQTAGSVHDRVKSQLSQANLPYEIVFQDAGIVGKREISDKEIHRYLAEKGFVRDGSSEWFRCTADDVKDALANLKEKYRSEDKRKELEQKFYEELRNWFFWATEETKNPDCSLRIVIRLLLCFFLRERGLVPACLFERSFIEENLKEDEYCYFKVVIRNLFFYSLNTPQDKRKELENKNVIKNYGVVKKLFHENIPFLNGGLFTEHSGDDIPLNDDYFFTAPRTRTLKELDGKFPVAGIVYILSQYKYTLDETENSELIDPEFIGKMFECLLAYIEADNKESRQKITGSYYTPREIVDYMVNEALDACLAGGSTNRLLNESSTNRTLSEIKILDPACGSGAFPCSVMNIILQHMSEGKTLTSAERYQAKLKILQSVIYGVDIQPMAVQIAMLRLFLSLIQEIQPDKSKYNFGIESLPNLDYKFVAANTLIGIGCNPLFFHTHKVLFNEIIALKRDHFKESNAEKREELRERIYLLEKDLADKSESQDIMALCEWNHSETEASPYFDSRWMFGIEKFDIVIGNPPYGADYPAEHKTYFKEHYQSAKTIKGKQKGSLDTFSLFIENAFHQVKQGGWVNFIVPISVGTSDAMEGLHKLLFANCEAIKMSSYSDRPQQIFKSAATKVSIIGFRRTDTKNKRLFTTKMYRKSSDETIEKILRDLRFVDSHGLTLRGRIPRISESIEKRILKKVFAFKTNIGSLLQEDGKPIYYRKSGNRYFLTITNYPTESNEERPLYFDKKIADSIGAILSSSFFFWFYQVYSDYRHLKNYEIEFFPIPVDRLTPDVTSRIERIYKRYLRDIEKNVREHQTEAYSKITSFKEYKIRYSKSIIDEIDDIICPLYGLTGEERDFIKNYELKFRIDE